MFKLAFSKTAMDYIIEQQEHQKKDGIIDEMEQLVIAIFYYSNST